MTTVRVVPAFYIFKDRHASLGLCAEYAPFDEFAFKGGEEAPGAKDENGARYPSAPMSNGRLLERAKELAKTTPEGSLIPEKTYVKHI